jgi:sRNA-binding protein
MASPRDKKVAAATTKLGRTIAGALRSWAKEVGADDLAGDVMDHVREGFDVVRDHAAAGQARTKARRAAKKASSSTAKKAPKNARSAAKRKTTRKTTRKSTVRKQK